MEQTEWVAETESSVKTEVERCSVCKSYDLCRFNEDEQYEEDNYGNEM